MEGPGVHSALHGTTSPKLIPAFKPLQCGFHALSHLPSRLVMHRDVPLDVFDVLTLPATAAPRLRGGAAWTGCGSPEGIFHDTPHPAALRTWIRPVQAVAWRKPSYWPQLFSALFFFPSSKLLLIFLFFPTEFKATQGSPAPTKAKPLGRAVGNQDTSVGHTSTPISPKPLIPSWEGCCSSMGTWSPKRKVPWDLRSALSWDVDGLFPAAVLQWGAEAAGEPAGDIAKGSAEQGDLVQASGG